MTNYHGLRGWTKVHFVFQAIIHALKGVAIEGILIATALRPRIKNEMEYGL